MTFILIFGALLLILYIFKFNTRDKTKDYQVQTQIQSTKTEVDFGWDLTDLVHDCLKSAGEKGESPIIALTTLKQSLLKDMLNIKRKYNLDESTVRKNIFYYIDEKINDINKTNR